MNRRDTLKLSLLASVLAAGDMPAWAAPLTTSRRQAHSLAIFLLALLGDNLAEILTDTPQNQLKGGLLRKVDPAIFASMRKYMKAQDTSFPAKMKDISHQIYAAANSDTSIYTDPDHCPCLLTDTCPVVEALLKVK